jgi:hypothetical protein
VPLTLLLFLVTSGRRAAWTSLLVGYLFLPQAAIDVPGAVDLSKSSVIGLGLLLGICLLDTRTLRGLRVRWFDWLMLVWCCCPLASSLASGLGPYDGASAALQTSLAWGVPYLVGRVYVRTAAEMRALVVGILLGGMVYVPLCLFEVRFSPQLHKIVYGFHQHSFDQTFRFEGWRPTVFLQHGLAVGLWMAVTATVAYWQWKTGRLPRLLGVAPWVIVAALTGTFLACKSFGALAILLFCNTALLLSSRLRSVRPLLILALVAPTYLVARVAFDWQPEFVLEVARAIDEERAASFEMRLDADTVLRSRALEQPIFGWGAWDSWREGLGPLPSDSLWAIVFGTTGLVGLISLFGVLVLAQVLPLRRLRLAHGHVLSHCDCVVLVTTVTMLSLDSLSNAMRCPILIAVAGATIAWQPKGLPAPTSTAVRSARGVPDRRGGLPSMRARPPTH